MWISWFFSPSTVPLWYNTSFDAELPIDVNTTLESSCLHCFFLKGGLF